MKTKIKYKTQKLEVKIEIKSCSADIIKDFLKEILPLLSTVEEKDAKP